MKTFLKSTTAIVALIGAMALLPGVAEAKILHSGATHEVSQVKQAKAEARALAKQAKADAKQAKADAKQAKADAKQAKADAAGDDDVVGSDDQGDDVVGSDDQDDDVVGSDDQGDDVDFADETDVEGVDD